VSLLPKELSPIDAPIFESHASSSRGTPRIAANTISMGKDGHDAVRVTTTLTKRQHDRLERIAEKNRVKVAWVVRRAVERLLEQAEGGPLLPLDLD